MDFIIASPFSASRSAEVAKGSNSCVCTDADGARLLSSRASTASREHIVFYNTNGDVGSIDTSASATAYNTSSDYRLKENIAPITNPIDRLMALSGNTFKWTAEFYATQDQALFKEYDVGVIAQEVQSVLPAAVNERENGMLAVDYTKLIPLLIECIKAQQVEINELKGIK